jgi:hypothetical protein
MICKKWDKNIRMKPKKDPKAGKYQQQGNIDLISVIVAIAIVTAVGLALLGSLATSFRSTQNSEPKMVGQTAVSNVQTDLNAITMYDPNALSQIHPGTTLTFSPPSPPPGSHYAPASTQATTITVQAVNPQETNSSGQATAANIQLNYKVPGANSTTTLEANSIVSVYQHAPGKPCGQGLDSSHVAGC